MRKRKLLQLNDEETEVNCKKTRKKSISVIMRPKCLGLLVKPGTSEHRNSVNPEHGTPEH